MGPGLGTSAVSLFDSAVAFIIDNIEGEHEQADPKDPGGDTWFGLARTYYPNEPWPPTRERAIQIYKDAYWDPISGDLLPGRLAVAVFDCAINEGTGTAIRLLQHTLGVDVDGHLGPQTLAAAMARAPRPLTRDFLTHRVIAYSKLPGFQNYAHSWVYRCFQIAGFVEALP